MIVRLPSFGAAGMCASMKGRFTSILLIFALLFGTVIMPTIAHAQAASASHSEEFVELHEHDNAAGQDTQKNDEDKPCHTVAHHHCSFALKVDATSLGLSSALSQNRFASSSHAAMTSLSQAPPTEPPAA